MANRPVLGAEQRAFLSGARRAVLATIDPEGRSRPVPICFVLDATAPILYTPLDDKPKRVDDPHDLARVRDILGDPRVTILVDRWDEDWTRLAWLRCEGRATIVEPDDIHHAEAVAALRAKYEQYVTQSIATRPLIRVEFERATGWSASPLSR